MHRLIVHESSPNTGRVVLSDEQGCLHIAHATAATPGVGTTLQAAQPCVGFGLLLSVDDRRPYRLIFEPLGSDGATA